MSSGLTRKLAAIMFTDVAGYTAMMQVDEMHARKLVNQYRETLAKVTAKYDGKILQHIGDGSLIIFPSAVQAVYSAGELQQIWSHQLKIPVKVSINIGDVAQEGDDIYGDGVNLASRLESIGVPGSVLMTDRVIRDISSHPDLTYQSMGQFQFKNISAPIEIFALAYGGLIIPNPNDLRAKTKQKPEEVTTPSRILWIIGVMTLLTLILYLTQSRGFTENEKSIAVLPFANMSEDETDYFADGIMEDILNRLSYIRDLKVISRTSSMHYKSTNKTLPEIAGELNVQYILEGSVRKAADQVKVNVTLVNAREDDQIWSQNFERGLEDIFAIQSEVASRIVSSLESRLSSQDSLRIHAAPTNSQEAYELYLKGKENLYWKVGNLDQALAQFLEALALDPGFYQAKAEIASVYFRYGYFGLMEEKVAFPIAYEMAQDVLMKNPNSVRAHSVLGLHDWFYRKWESARDHFRQALQIKSNDADTYDNYADLLSYTANFPEAIKMSKKAIELNPLSSNFQTHLVEILAYAGDYVQAQSQLEKIYKLFPGIFVMEEAELAIGLKKYSRAASVYQELWDLEPHFGNFKLGHLSTLYALIDEERKALETRKLINESNIEYHSMMGISHIGTGEVDSVFHHLDLALDRYEGNASMILCQPIYKLISDDDRFVDLLKKAGLYEYHLQYYRTDLQD